MNLVVEIERFPAKDCGRRLVVEVHAVRTATQRRVVEDEVDPGDLEALPQDIPGRAPFVVDDGPGVAEDGVEERRFSRIGESRDGGDDAGVDPGGFRGAFEQVVDFPDEGVERGRQGVEPEVGLVEDERGLDGGEQLLDFVRQGADVSRQAAFHQAPRHVRTRGAPGGDERAHAFGLGEIDLAVPEGPPRELAFFRQPRPPGAPDEPHDAVHDQRVAMAADLGEVLARVRAGGGVEDRHGLLHDPVVPVLEGDGHRNVRGPDFAPGDGGEDLPRAGAADPHGADAASPPGRGFGIDGVAYDVVPFLGRMTFL